MRSEITMWLKSLFKVVAIILLMLPSIFVQSSYGQKGRGSDSKEAYSLLRKKEYAKAEVIYERLVDSEPSNTFYNYGLGVCYFNSKTHQFESIEMLEIAVENFESLPNSAPEDAYYFLARAYHLAHQFNKAIGAFTKYKRIMLMDLKLEERNLWDRFEFESEGFTDKEFKAKFISNDEVIILINSYITDIDNRIRMCNYGKVLKNNPVDAIVENLGEIINTDYSEYGPVVSSKEDKLAFTRRSPDTEGGKISPDGDYFEDIYLTTIHGGNLFKSSVETDKAKAGYVDVLSKLNFTLPAKIGENINTSGHEGAIQFSNTGDKLYFYKESNVWVSELREGTWGPPSTLAGLDDIINTKGHEPSVSISLDESVVFIVSDRKGGFGGLDIYKSVRQRDGSWGEAVNLGETINTPFDEDGPYVDPDGSTLYFSSKGHSSMGGYDVFKSQFKGEYWTRPPQNMGFPVNSAADDIFYTMTPRYNRAYYSSSKLGGYGGMDIYRVTFANERHQLAEVKGLVLEGEKLVPAKSKISIIDDEYNEVLSIHESDSTTGDYLLLLGHGKSYTIKVETYGFAPYLKSFTIPKQVYYYQFYQEVHHIHIKDKEGNIIGQKITMHNALFDLDKMLSPIIEPGMVPQTELLQLMAKKLQGSYDEFKKDAEQDTSAEAQLLDSYAQLMKQFTDDTEIADSALRSGELQAQAVELLQEYSNMQEANENPERIALMDSTQLETVVLLDTYSEFIKNIAAVSPDVPEFVLIDSAAYKGLSKSASYSKFIASLNASSPDVNYNEVTDIKFYVSQDSLIELMKEDTFLREEVKKILAPQRTQNAEVDIEPKIIDETAEKTAVDGIVEQTAVDTVEKTAVDGIVEQTVIDTVEKTAAHNTEEKIAVDGTVEKKALDLSFMDDLEIYFFEPKNPDATIKELESYVLPSTTKPEEEEDDPSAGSGSGSGEEVEVEIVPINIDFPGISGDDLILNVVKSREEVTRFFEQEYGQGKVIILFAYDNNYFPLSAKRGFELVSEAFKTYPDLKFDITGFADAKGAAEYNHRLSERRAKIIANYFSKGGLSLERFSVNSKGELEPIVPNYNLDGTENTDNMRLNRRVEIIVRKSE